MLITLSTERLGLKQSLYPQTMCKYTRGKRQDSLLRPKITHSRITDDYRSIIKDLRIENERLKGELRRYRHLDQIETRGRPFFEITANMLPSRKKRELEVLLHDFMLNVTGQSGTNLQPSAIIAYAYRRNLSARGSNRHRTVSMPTFQSNPQCIWVGSVGRERARQESRQVDLRSLRA